MPTTSITVSSGDSLTCYYPYPEPYYIPPYYGYYQPYPVYIPPTPQFTAEEVKQIRQLLKDHGMEVKDDKKEMLEKLQKFVDSLKD